MRFSNEEDAAEGTAGEGAQPDSLSADATPPGASADAGPGHVREGGDADDHGSLAPPDHSDTLPEKGIRDTAPGRAGADAVDTTVEVPVVATDASPSKHRAPTVATVWGPRLVWMLLGVLTGLAVFQNFVGTDDARPETPVVAPQPQPEPVPTSPGAPRDQDAKDDQGSKDHRGSKDDKGSKDDQETTGEQATNASGGATGGGSGSGGTSVAPERRAQEPATDFLSADGSADPDDNPWWSQSTVTVRTTTRLTELKVVVRIIQTGGVASTGTWSSLGDKVNVASAADSEQLAYVVTLKEGVTVDPGTYVFQFQYNHDGPGRDTSRDLYNVTATSADSTTEYLTGDLS